MRIKHMLSFARLYSPLHTKKIEYNITETSSYHESDLATRHQLLSSEDQKLKPKPFSFLLPCQKGVTIINIQLLPKMEFTDLQTLALFEGYIFLNCVVKEKQRCNLQVCSQTVSKMATFQSQTTTSNLIRSNLFRIGLGQSPLI